MTEAYGPLYGAIAHVTQEYTTGEAWRVGVGILAANGDPILDPSWTVNKSELGTLVFPIEGAFLYGLTNKEEDRFFAPYVGIGAGGFVGFERTSVDSMYHAPEGSFDWNDTRFRYTLGGHVLLGTSVRITGKVQGLLEIRWTQSGKGSVVEQTFSPQDIAEGWLELSRAVKRPDFNFTGWSVSLGARW